MNERWWSAPMEGDSGKTVIVTGRDYLDSVIESARYPYLIRVAWRYNALSDGFPDKIDEELMGRVSDALESTFSKDKAAYLVAIFTGDGQRDWLFYTKSLPLFNKIFNKALADIEETVPFEIEAREDAGWSEYREMRELTYIPPEEN